MKNPATIPFLIMMCGLTWHLFCELTLSWPSWNKRFSPSSAFWTRYAGIFGWVIATLIALAYPWFA